MKRKVMAAGMTPRAREMARLIEEQEASGLSVRSFAESRGMSPGTLHWWRREIRLRTKADRGARDLVPLRVVEMRAGPAAGPGTGTGFRIEFSEGRRSIEVPSDFDASTLRRLLEVVGSC